MRKAMSFLAGCLVGATVGVGGLAYVAVAHPDMAKKYSRSVVNWMSHQAKHPEPSSPLTAVVTVELRDGQPISQLIYGVSESSPETVRALGATLNRWGGNPETRYNWVNGHAWNAARDWEFRNGNYDNQGAVADRFVAQTLAAGAIPVMTVPTLGWVAKDDDNEHRSTNVPEDGGPPAKAGSDSIAGYDPARNRLTTSVPSRPRNPGSLNDPIQPNAPAVYQNEWIHHLMGRFGSGPEGVHYFTMDNEPDLWAYTHTDVHPVRMSYDDMVRNYLDYATAVKEQDPKAVLLGPDVSGWNGYFWSALDRGSDNYRTHADRRAHGDEDFLPWWLKQVRKADVTRGSRSINLLDVHYYPQADKVYSDNSDPDTQRLRINSTRGLWDPSYRDESWINQPVRLIPRLREWADRSYPGTGVAITEYSWGGEKDASGAVALADVLGTFGREGVQLAAYWTHPPVDSPAGAAFRLYRNNDGRGGHFGDIGLPARSTDPFVGVYAARHSDGSGVDLILVNRSVQRTATIKISGIDVPAARWQMSSVEAGSSSILPATTHWHGEHVTLAAMSLLLIHVPGD